MMRRRAFWLAAAIIGVWWFWSGSELKHPPGVLIEDEPIQVNLGNNAETWVHEGMNFTALADFEVQGRILGARRYRTDAAAFLSPMDLALGWGKMSDTAVLEKLRISQRNRFYWYRWYNRPPIPQGEIVRSSANMHLIPANDRVRSVLLKARKGQLVHFRGKLVRVDGEPGWTWKSSMTRNDSGDGACEIIWVEMLEFADHPDELLAMEGF